MLVDEVRRTLGRDPFVARGDADYLLRVFSPSAPTPVREIHLELTARNGTLVGTRRLVLHGRCEAMTEPLTLVLAMMVDLSREDASIRIRPPPPQAPAASFEESLPLRETDTDNASLDFGAMAGVEMGLAPWPVPLFGVGLSLGITPWFALRVDAEVVPLATLARGEVGVDFGAAMGALGACLRIGFDAGHALFFCAEGRLGASWGTGFGVDAPRTSLALLAGVGGSTRGRLALDRRVFVELSLRLVGAIVRPRFAIEASDSLQSVHLVAPLGGEAMIGLVTRLF